MMNRIDDLSPMIGSSDTAMLAEEVAQDEQGDEEREGEEQVGDPHQDVVEHPAAQPATAPTIVPMSTDDERRRDADEQRDAAAVDEPAVEVAADVVGAEPGDRAAAARYVVRPSRVDRQTRSSTP